MSYTDVLDRPIAFHRIYADVAGSAAGGIFLSQLVYWAKRMEGKREDGMFYKTIDEWAEETALTRYEQESARKQLKKVGVLKVKRKGVPAKLYYLVDFDALDRVISQLVESSKQESDIQQTSKMDSTNKKAKSSKQESDLQQTSKLDSADKFAGIQQTITENTQRPPETNSDTNQVEASASSHLKKYRDIDLSLLPSEIPVDSAKAFIDHRIVKKSKLTQHAFELFCKEVLKGPLHGLAVTEVIDEAILAGWTGFKVEWVIKRLDQGAQPAGGAVGGRSVRDVSLGEQLTDTSWADGVMPAESNVIEGEVLDA